jgi:cell division protein FtsI (penicillin-binding protein 3)
MNPLPKIMRGRLFWLGLFFVILSLVVIGRASQFQIFQRDEYRERSRGYWEKTIVIKSTRGDIYDCRLEKLATSVPTETLVLHGGSVKEAGEAFLKLSESLDLGYEKLASIMEKASRYVVLKRNISESESKAVKELSLDGVGIEKDHKRIYPNGSLAAHLLGFVGLEGNGLEGLELALNTNLIHPPVKLKLNRDKRGRYIMRSADEAMESSRGASVVLTIDRRIQFIAEKALAKAVVENNAKSGMAIAVRPRTGEIIASAIYPTFDPNNYGEADVADRRNRILTDPFEPGSTFKVFTVAAALEEGLVTPDSVFFCENGSYKVDGDTSIRDTGAYGDMTVSAIVQKSSNIGAAKIGERLGSRRLHNYLTRFSFGEKSGLAYPSGESAGKLRPVTDWHVVDASTISFGQGLSVTALQLVMAAAALGNDGVLMRPMLVSRVIDADGNVLEERNPEIIRQVVSPLTARQVLAMMRMAVMKGGTGTRGDIPEYPIAAKTGTSQKFNVAQGVYSHDRYIASYVGLAPYENPELCLYVVLDEPWPRYYGGVVAAPVFKEIMEEALPLLDVPTSDKESLPNWPSLDNAKASKSSAPGVLLDYASANFVRTALPKGDKGAKGPIAPFYKSSVPNLEKASYAPRGVLPSSSNTNTNASPGVMPDLTRLSMREVMDALAPHSLSLEFLGTGLVYDQEPSPASPIIKGQLARIYFRGKSG